MSELKRLIRALYEVSAPQWERWEPKPRTFEAAKLLDAARQQMEEIHARNRSRAVQAITKKNNLLQTVRDTERKIERLEEKARTAEERGDAELAKQYLREQEGYRTSLESVRDSVADAEALADEIKRSIFIEQDNVRTKTAKLLALRIYPKSVDPALNARRIQSSAEANFKFAR